MAQQPTPWQPPKNEQIADQPLSGGDVFIPAPSEKRQRERRAEERDETRLDLSLEGEDRADRAEQFGRIDTYRKEFLADPTVRQFKGVESAARQIVTLATRTDNDEVPGPGDIGLIFSFMKALDPDSAVREGEYATARNSGGIPEAVTNYYNRVLTGGQLSPELRREFAQTAISLYNSRRATYDQFAETYRGRIADFGGDPDREGIRLSSDLTLPDVGGSETPTYAIVTPEQSAAVYGEARYDAQGRPVGADYTGDSFYDADGNFVSINVRVTDEMPGAPDPREEMGILESIGETITGAQRSTEEIKNLPDWATMPEMNSLSVDSFQAALGTMMTDPAETVAVLRAQFPGLQVRQDENGNYILRSSMDGQEYAIKPGFRPSDIPRAVGSLAAFTPAGRATTAGGAFAAGAGTQALVEGTQAATGGEFNSEEVLLAGATNALIPGVVNSVRAVRGRPAAQPMAPAQPDVQAAPTQAPPMPAVAAQAAPEAAALSAAEQTELGTVARQAIGRGPAAREAQTKLAIMAQVDPEAKAAADRLGIELPTDVLSNDARLLTVTGLARSQIGSDAQTAWGQTVSQAIQKADETLASLGASRDLASVSRDVNARLQSDMEALEAAGNALRADVNAAIDVRGRVDAQNLQAALGQRINDLGGIKEAKQAFSAEEKKLLAMLGEGEVANRPTYARLDQIRDDIGRALFKKQGPWVDTNEAALNRYYAALAQDRVDHVASIGGEELADKLRASNDTFVKMYGVRDAMQTLFGKQLQNDIGKTITSALTGGKKGDGKALRTILQNVPEDMRAGALLTGMMAKVERPGANGGFSFKAYADLYRGLRQNAPIYKEIADTIGPDAERILRDLYSISKRVANAEDKIVRTGASNQPLLNALNAESLVGKLAATATKRAAVVGATAAAGGVAGGPAGAAAGAALGEALQKGASQAGKTNLDRLHGVLTSGPFLDLVDKVATGTVKDADINKLANDGAFRRFARLIGVEDAAGRKAWLRSAMMTGAGTQALSDPEPVTR